ncbi:MAG TPA: hypothetical protein VFM05_09435, partial [Candidatus Saccharimonadales bacterium]|nr:hypothetical protein [Candidatus Saccharimonadales bacterium]
MLRKATLILPILALSQVFFPKSRMALSNSSELELACKRFPATVRIKELALDLIPNYKVHTRKGASYANWRSSRQSRGPRS